MTFRTATFVVLGFGTLAGCSVSSKSNLEAASKKGGALTPVYGVDYSYARPSPSHLESEGYQFAARYLSYDSAKNITASEANALKAAGVDIVANWEAGSDDALQGYQKGVQEAQTAQAQAAAAGMPADRPIYFSVDFDASESQQGAIDAYFDGVASVIGSSRVGAYAGYWVIKRLFDHGKITWGWQSASWSGGNWDPRAQLRQVDYGLEGGDLDKDEAVVGDYGQWGATGNSTTTTQPTAEGSQAFLYPSQQHFVNSDGAGNIRHHWWDAGNQMITTDTWGSGTAGEPVSFVDGTSQHVFARGTDGSLLH